MRNRLLALALVLAPFATTAQQAQPVAVPDTGAILETPAPELEPFVASYLVYRGGKPLGEATCNWCGSSHRAGASTW